MTAVTEPSAMFAFPGVITYVAGERGVVRHITYSNGEPTGALVRLDERPAVVHVELGMIALTCTCGREGRRTPHHEHCDLLSKRSSAYREVLGWRDVGRDEFDRLTGIEGMRAEFGWDLG